LRFAKAKGEVDRAGLILRAAVVWHVGCAHANCQFAVRYVPSALNLSGVFAGGQTGRLVVRGPCDDPRLISAVFYWDYLSKHKICGQDQTLARLALDAESSMLNGELHFDFVAPMGENPLALLRVSYDLAAEERFQHYHQSHFYFTFHRLSRLIEGARYRLTGGVRQGLVLDDYQHLNLKKLHDDFAAYFAAATVYVLGTQNYGADTLSLRHHDLWAENPCACPPVVNPKSQSQIVVLDSAAVHNVGEMAQSLLSLTAYFVAYAEMAKNAGLQLVVTHSMFRFCNRYILIHGKPDEIAYLRSQLERLSPTINEKTLHCLHLFMERLENGLTPDAPFEILFCHADFFRQIKNYKPVYEKNVKLAVL
jgi:hypothetical protein